MRIVQKLCSVILNLLFSKMREGVKDAPNFVYAVCTCLLGLEKKSLKKVYDKGHEMRVVYKDNNSYFLRIF